jgi:hypothetical protein
MIVDKHERLGSMAGTVARASSAPGDHPPRLRRRTRQAEAILLQRARAMMTRYFCTACVRLACPARGASKVVSLVPSRSQGTCRRYILPVAAEDTGTNRAHEPCRHPATLAGAVAYAILV